jgi:hypothetical protein
MKTRIERKSANNSAVHYYAVNVFTVGSSVIQRTRFLRRNKYVITQQSVEKMLGDGIEGVLEIHQPIKRDDQHFL